MSLNDIFTYDFTRHALLLALMASVPLGIIGTLIVVRRIGYLAGAMSHCALGGVGVGLWIQSLALAAPLAWLGEPLVTSLIFSLGSAVLIGFMGYVGGEREDTAIGVVWATGMALGLLALDFVPGNPPITAYLFGDILLISTRDLWLVGTLSLGVLLVWLVWRSRLEAVCFDAEFAAIRGLAAGMTHHLLLLLTAVTVVLMLRLVGMLLVVALLTLPAAAAARLTKRLFPMILVAIGLCWVASWGGLITACCWNLSSGPTIIVWAAVLYVGVMVGTSILRHSRVGGNPDKAF